MTLSSAARRPLEQKRRRSRHAREWLSKYLSELWYGHRGELIAIVTTLGFWLADVKTSVDVSVWALLAVTVLLIYLGAILLDTLESTAAFFGVVDVPYSIVTHKSLEEAELVSANHLQALKSQGLSTPKVFRRFLVSSTDWRYFDQLRRPSGDLKQLAQDIRAHFIRLSNRVTSQARYHLFFVTTPTVALGLGAMIGRDIRCRSTSISVQRDLRSSLTQRLTEP